MSPRVSVLIPAFNAADTLALTLRSVQRQTEPRFECLLVDDGSQDDTVLIGRRFAASDSRFRVLSRPHAGLIATLNAGIEACRGELIARMDADDWMHRQRLAAQLAKLDAEPHLAGVGCHVRLFPRRNLSNGLRRYEQWLNSMQTTADVAREAFIECPLAHPSIMLRRAIMTAYRYHAVSWAEDYDLLLRLLADGYALGVVPRRLLMWRDQPSRLSRTDERYAIGRFTDCRAHFLAQGPLRDRHQYVLWGYGGTGKALRKALERHDKQPCAIVELHPGRLGQKIFGAPVIPPAELPRYRAHPIVVSVAGEVARTQIRQAMAEMQFTEVRDFVMCA